LGTDSIADCVIAELEKLRLQKYAYGQMPEPVSVGIGLLAGYTALQLAARASSAVSPEARTVRQNASALVDSAERSVALFGPKNTALSELFALVAECSQPGWNGDDAIPLEPLAASLAADFIRAFPDNLPLPEFTPEPDGCIALDWIESPTRHLSVSFGLSNRLAYAWLDGTDQGHGVASFNGETLPPRIIATIHSIVGNGDTSLRAA
jgi:hypothetical protein